MTAVLPVHPSTGVTALGVLPSGRIVWPVLGGSEPPADPPKPGPPPGAPVPAGPPPADPPADPPAGGDPDDPEGADALGDKGKNALDAMKTQRNEARSTSKALVEWLAVQYKKTPDDIRALISGGKLDSLIANAGNQQGGEDKPEVDADAIRAEAAREASKKASDRILRSEIKAAAAGKLADPADAYKFLDLDKFEATDGEFDSEEIADAITDLLKSKPYLAAAATAQPKFGSSDGGVRNGNKPSQLTQADLASMSPKEIDTARKEGRLDRLMGRNA